MEIIKNYATGKKILVSIDESADSKHRFIGNVVIGTLEFYQPGKIFLLTKEFLEESNYSIYNYWTFWKIHFYFMAEWKTPWRHLVVFIRYSPLYCKISFQNKVLYSKLFHITCLAHVLMVFIESRKTLEIILQKLTRLLPK